ncbi:MAG: hypothetical protein MR759_07645 [Ruminococcus sp.]|nr:hypothetical protein [Ruminococcus sp.]
MRFAVQIFDKTDNRKIYLENVSDSQITKNITITTHPVVSGEEIADHYYKEPITMTINGVISLNGSKSEVLEGSTVKGNPRMLRRFEEVFERVQNDGHLCDIVKIQRGESGSYRFSKRENMVLTAISWTEGINTLGFNMTFTQALIVDQTIFEDDNRIDTGKTDRDNNNTLPDETLPNVNVPDKTSFAREIVDWDVIEAQIVASLRMAGVFGERFFTAALSINYLSEPLTEEKVRDEKSIRNVTLADIQKACRIFALSLDYIGKNNPFELDVIEKSGKHYNKERNRMEGMEGTRTDPILFAKDPVRSLKHVGQFIKELDGYLKSLESHYEMYRFPQSGEQDVLVTIGNEDFVFQVRNNNVNGSYKITVLQGQNSAAENPVSVGGISDIRGGISTYMQATNSNAILRTGGGQYVHLLKLEERTVGLEYFALVISPVQYPPDSFIENIRKITRSFVGGGFIG